LSCAPSAHHRHTVASQSGRISRQTAPLDHAVRPPARGRLTGGTRAVHGRHTTSARALVARKAGQTAAGVLGWGAQRGGCDGAKPALDSTRRTTRRARAEVCQKSSRLKKPTSKMADVGTIRARTHQLRLRVGGGEELELEVVRLERHRVVVRGNRRLRGQNRTGAFLARQRLKVCIRASVGLLAARAVLAPARRLRRVGGSYHRNPGAYVAREWRRCG